MITDHLGKEYKSISEMCRMYSINRSVYNSRIKYGWDKEKALTTPSLKQDLTGKDFNFLHVVELTGYSSEREKRIWKCRCKCGKIIFISTDKIINGHTKSCGCIREDIVHKSMRKPNKGKDTKGIHYKKSMEKYISRIMRNGKNYNLGVFESEKDAQAIYNIANSFTDIKDLEQWFKNKKYYFGEFENICITNGVDILTITNAIYDGFDEKLYLNINELEKYIEEFSESYFE